MGPLSGGSRDLVSPAGSKPVWAIVELGHPSPKSDWPTITPPQVRAAVWQSLIAGARGIVYFNHSFGGPDQTQHILRDGTNPGSPYAPIRSVVTAINSEIAALAPVLNSPTVTSGWSHGAGTTAMVKWAARQKSKAKKACASKNRRKPKKKCKRKGKAKAASQEEVRVEEAEEEVREVPRRMVICTCSPAQPDRQSREVSRCRASATSRPPSWARTARFRSGRDLQRPLRRRERDPHLPHQRRAAVRPRLSRST